MSNSNIRFSLRSKLMLLPIAVLIIPYMGFYYLRQMESYLRDTLQASLVDTAYAVTGSLNDKPRLFDTSFNEDKNNLYVHRLNNTVQFDRYTDWESYIDWSDAYHSDSSSILILIN